MNKTVLYEAWLGGTRMSTERTADYTACLREAIQMLVADGNEDKAMPLSVARITTEHIEVPPGCLQRLIQQEKETPAAI